MGKPIKESLTVEVTFEGGLGVRYNFNSRVGHAVMRFKHRASGVQRPTGLNSDTPVCLMHPCTNLLTLQSLSVFTYNGYRTRSVGEP